MRGPWRAPHSTKIECGIRNGGHGAKSAPLPTLQKLARYFGCGTIRIYGFGDFQPCG
jgi:hypothetical protein